MKLTEFVRKIVHFLTLHISGDVMLSITNYYHLPPMPPRYPDFAPKTKGVNLNSSPPFNLMHLTANKTNGILIFRTNLIHYKSVTKIANIYLNSYPSTVLMLFPYH